MPPIDRTLLRIGVAELISTDRPRARGTVNGLMEIAKRYGEEQTPRFVNGILDQVRRNLNIPFN
jgi:N utilization substance protein B